MDLFTKLLSVLLLCCGAFTLQAQQMTFEADLGGRHEALPVYTTAFGEVTATLEGDTLTVEGFFQDLSSNFNTEIGAHLHIGYAGENGPIAIDLNPNVALDQRNGTFEPEDNTFALTADQRTALMERRMYVNIHTIAFPGGELRGQVVPQAENVYHLNLLGSNEVPAVMTQAAGAAVVEEYADSIIVSGTFSGLESDFATSIGAHLHTGLTGQNGPVDIVLVPALSPDLRSGTFVAADNGFAVDMDQKNRLQGRGYYLNVHSEANASGEIRGQVVAADAQVAFRARLAGANEEPTVTSNASGVVQLELDGDTLIVTGAFDGLESNFASDIGLHLHSGAAGTNGPVSVVLNADLGSEMRSGDLLVDNNTYVLSAQQKEDILARGFYVNVHSVDNPAGEIRGQVLPEAQIVFNGDLSGIYEKPNSITSGFGAMSAELMGETVVVSGSFNNLSSAVDLSIAGGAHLHAAPAGRNGDIVFELDSDLDLDQTAGVFSGENNTFSLDSTQIALLRARKIYANIHTLNFSPGELRAQMVPEANYYLVASLSGASEVRGVDTEGRGQVILEVIDSSFVVTGGYADLESSLDTDIGAHIHDALAGRNSGVVQGLTPSLEGDGTSGTFEASQNVYVRSSGFIDTLRNRMAYVNIHSETQAAGEIRGQILPSATAFFTTTLSGLNEVQPIMSSAQGAAKLELNGNVLTVTGAFDSLQSDFNADIAGGAHLHIAGPGGNGGIDTALVTTLAADLRSGAFMADSNRYVLDSAQIMTLMNEDYYINIHSTDIPSGELRGQTLAEVNFFPSNPPAITAPADGGTVILEGEISSLISIGWEDTAEDANEIVYIWQVALDPDFENIVFQTNVGTNLGLDLTVGALDTLLAGLNVDMGATATVFHRAVASDGAVQATGEANEANFTRGDITDVDDLIDAEAGYKVYPTVNRGQLTVDFELKEVADTRLVLRNAVGQQLQVQDLGNIDRFAQQIDLGNRPQGMYFLELNINGEPAALRRIVIRR